MSVRTADVAPRAPASIPHLLRAKRARQETQRLGLSGHDVGIAGFCSASRRKPASRSDCASNLATLWLLVLLAGLLALIQPKAAVAALTLAPTLKAIQIGIVVVGLGWVVLIVDAWRLANPGEQGRWGRVVFSALTMAVALTIFGGFMAVASMASAQRELTTSVFSGGGDQVAKQGRYNILLLGGDAGRNRVGLRPDSMTVASVDSETGRTVLISLPRNLQAVPFPSYSPLHDRFPNGYRCSDHSCMLNAIYTYASEHRDLYPGVQNPGAQATKEAVEGATGLKINYWVLIDLKGFQSLVDAVGGITMDVYRRVPIGGGSTKISGYVEAGKNRHLTGYQALWFARSRADSSDYDRVLRQKCVMRAMLNQFDPITVLTRFNSIAAASRESGRHRHPNVGGRHHDRSGAQGQSPPGIERGHHAATDRSELSGL